MEERPLVLAVIDACLLVELCGVDEIDADSATRAMSAVRSQLMRLRHDDQVERRAQLAEIADESVDDGFATLVGGLADRLGLAKPRADAHRSWR